MSKLKLGRNNKIQMLNKWSNPFVFRTVHCPYSIFSQIRRRWMIQISKAIIADSPDQPFHFFLLILPQCQWNQKFRNSNPNTTRNSRINNNDLGNHDHAICLSFEFWAKKICFVWKRFVPNGFALFDDMFGHWKKKHHFHFVIKIRPKFIFKILLNWQK